MKERFQIDTRPLILILLQRFYRHALFFTGLGWVVYLLAEGTPPPGLSPQAYKCILVFLFTTFSWILNIVPPVIPAIMAVVLLWGGKAVEAQVLLHSFANPVVFFLLSALLLAGALMESGTGTLIARGLLRAGGHSPRLLPLLIYNAAAFLSFLIPEHAVAAILLPVVIETISQLKLRRGSLYARLLILSLTWGSITGGIATLLGGARNPLAIGILQEITGKQIAFVEWLHYSIIPSLFLIAGGQILLWLFFRKGLAEVEGKDIQLRARPAGIRAYLAGLVFVVVIVFWIRSHTPVALALIGLTGAACLFIFNIVRWVDVEDTVNWGVFLMYGGAISLGSAMYSTGAARWIASALLNPTAHGPVFTVLILVVVTLILTEGMSNSAAVAVILPVAIGAFESLGLPPEHAVFVVALPAGLPFILPAGTPATALAFSTGHISIKDTGRVGLLMHLLTITVIIASYFFIWR